MFSMSLKSVPGCLVLIAPMLIGVPVAATPGLLPQDEAETVPPAADELDAEEAAALVAAGALEDAGAPLEVELVELELQAARTPSDSSAAAAAAVRVRQWTGLFMCSAFCWLTARD
jgi:ABC-type proline/glycine betaine transport system substrate-binding protein